MSNCESGVWGRFLPSAFEPSRGFPFASAAAGQRVLVTGAGGFIGSGLVKAIAGGSPAFLVLLDSSEHNLVEIKRQLERVPVPHEAFLGTVEDTDLLDGVLRRFRPEIIYHTAAFKHVPLLELNPVAAVRNNAIATWALAQAAIRHGVSKVVLISTDKAVNPHSVMGVSKRIAELAVVALSSFACRMNAIRLGNVIGSSGSVVPAFLRQIAECRPVTVTHPEVSRWFLTLPETIAAILAGGAAECEGRILLPDLGEPVRIADLAGFLIRAAGKELPIRFTGLRPGDKLTEELILKSETKDGLVPGPLSVVKTCRLAPAQLDDIVKDLSARVAMRDSPGLIRMLSSVVPEYVPSELVRKLRELEP